ncbi:MAG: dihydrodipicolinate synthase family protein [Rubripirellula sp.]
MKTPLTGLIAATVTPLGDDGSLQLDAIGPMIDQLIASGVNGIYVCGSTGEGMSLTSQERKLVVEASVQAVGGRIPVIVQVGHNSLAEAIDLARHAGQAGADIISATCPSYFKVNHHQVLAQCMRQIATTTDLPFYYYHIPALTDSRVDVMAFLAAAGEIPNFAGMKYTATALHEFQSCQRFDDGRYDIVWGCDEMLLAAWSTGAKAAIGSTYNIAAPLYQRVIDAIESGDFETARAAQFQSVTTIEIMKQYSFHSALKAVMGMLGMPGGPCRLPLTDLDDHETQTLREQLEEVNFFEWCGHPKQSNGQAS